MKKKYFHLTILTLLIFNPLQNLISVVNASDSTSFHTSSLNGTWTLSYGSNSRKKVNVYIFQPVNCPYFSYITPVDKHIPNLKEYIYLTRENDEIDIFISSSINSKFIKIPLKRVNSSLFKGSSSTDLGLVKLKKTNNTVPLRERVTKIQSYVFFKNASRFQPTYHDNSINYKSSIVIDNKEEKKFFCYYFPIEFDDFKHHYSTFYVYSNGETSDWKFPIPLRKIEDNEQALPGYFDVKLIYSKEIFDKFEIFNIDDQVIGEFLILPNNSPYQE